MHSCCCRVICQSCLVLFGCCVSSKYNLLFMSMHLQWRLLTRKQWTQHLSVHYSSSDLMLFVPLSSLISPFSSIVLSSLLSQWHWRADKEQREWTECKNSCLFVIRFSLFSHLPVLLNERVMKEHQEIKNTRSGVNTSGDVIVEWRLKGVYLHEYFMTNAGWEGLSRKDSWMLHSVTCMSKVWSYERTLSLLLSSKLHSTCFFSCILEWTILCKYFSVSITRDSQPLDSEFQGNLNFVIVYHCHWWFW